MSNKKMVFPAGTFRKLSAVKCLCLRPCLWFIAFDLPSDLQAFNPRLAVSRGNSFLVPPGQASKGNGRGIFERQVHKKRFASFTATMKQVGKGNAHKLPLKVVIDATDATILSDDLRITVAVFDVLLGSGLGFFDGIALDDHTALVV